MSEEGILLPSALWLHLGRFCIVPEDGGPRGRKSQGLEEDLKLCLPCATANDTGTNDKIPARLALPLRRDREPRHVAGGRGLRG